MGEAERGTGLKAEATVTAAAGALGVVGVVPAGDPATFLARSGLKDVAAAAAADDAVGVVANGEESFGAVGGTSGVGFWNLTSGEATSGVFSKDDRDESGEDRPVWTERGAPLSTLAKGEANAFEGEGVESWVFVGRWESSLLAFSTAILRKGLAVPPEKEPRPVRPSRRKLPPEGAVGGESVFLMAAAAAAAGGGVGVDEAAEVGFGGVCGGAEEEEEDACGLDLEGVVLREGALRAPAGFFTRFFVGEDSTSKEAGGKGDPPPPLVLT